MKFNPLFTRNTPDIPRLNPARLIRKGKLLFALFAVLVVLLFCLATPALAEGDPLTVINNLSTFIFSVIRAVGMILLGWGIVQVGLSFQSHHLSPALQWFSDAGGRNHHHLCQRNP